LSLRPALLFVIACAPLAAHAASAPQLIGMINHYRSAPASCGGQALSAQAPYAAPPQLSSVHIGAGAFLDLALERVGFPVAKADLISISNAEDAASAMGVLREHYCGRLRSAEFSAIGVQRTGDDWTIILALPQPPRVLPELGEAGQAVLRAVNAARAAPRLCGEQHYPPVGPVKWNPALGNAALAHSRDMAELRYFSHVEKNGSTAGERALSAGYRWRRIGENIASGQDSADEAVEGWLSSPGHCANIMRPGFTEMGAAFAISSKGTLYWTQVFAAPL
jgi:uncharacterized protein YkwD